MLNITKKFGTQGAFVLPRLYYQDLIAVCMQTKCDKILNHGIVLQLCLRIYMHM